METLYTKGASWWSCLSDTLGGALSIWDQGSGSSEQDTQRKLIPAIEGPSASYRSFCVRSPVGQKILESSQSQRILQLLKKQVQPFQIFILLVVKQILNHCILFVSNFSARKIINSLDNVFFPATGGAEVCTCRDTSQCGIPVNQSAVFSLVGVVDRLSKGPPKMSTSSSPEPVSMSPSTAAGTLQT